LSTLKPELMNNPVSFEEFYMATGKAIAAWQALEDALCDVFSRTVICTIAGTMLGNPIANRLIGGIFYSSTNFRSNLNMIESAIEMTINDEEIKAEWNAIRNKALTLYKRRNTLAHGHVWGNEAGASSVAASLFNANARNHLNYEQVCASQRSFSRLAERSTTLAIRINHFLAKA
jgi:hypothetical protein